LQSTNFLGLAVYQFTLSSSKVHFDWFVIGRLAIIKSGRISLNTDLCFARPKIRGWEAQSEGLVKIMSKRSTAHFAFCNN
jgi:hypothetical protein